MEEAPKGALRVVRAAGGLVVLNPAPARALPDDLLERVDVLVPNRVELAQLTRADPPLTLDQAAALAAGLPARAVTVTLGAEGALVVERGRPGRTVHVPYPDQRRVPRELMDLVRQCGHELAVMLGRTAPGASR